MKNKRLLFIILIVSMLTAFHFFLKAIYVPVIIMYHSIDTQLGADKLKVCPESFKRPLEFMKTHGYKVISLDDMVDRIKAGTRIPPRTVAITFDDGLKNNFDCAYPLLKEYGFPATFFVITDFVGSENYMTWRDIAELKDDPDVTIGSHSVTHRMLPYLTDEELRSEIFGSKAVLEESTGMDIKFFCYPAGRFNDKVRQLVIDAGYKAACATNPGKRRDWRDIFALKRVRISRTSDNLLVFLIETSGYYTFIKEHRDSE